MKGKRLMGVLTAIMMLMTGGAMAFSDGSEITVVSREAGSGTRGAFIELTGVEVKDESGKKRDMTYEDAIIQSSTAQVITTVASDENAIGYISLGSMTETVKAVAIDETEATVENILSGEYKVARPFNIAYAGEPDGCAKDFIAYMLSQEGQAIVREKGYIALEPQPYEAAHVSGKIVVGGSSSVAPVMEKLIEAYQAKNPSAQIELQVSDSTTGMKSALEGTYSIGMASRELKQSELDAGLTCLTIARDGIAVIVNPSNPVAGLTTEQVRGVFTGEITTWEID